MNRYLIVIDVQNDFVNMALGTKEAQAIIPHVKAKIAECRNNGGTVIFTRDTHQANYLQTNEGKYLPVEHCIEGTKGWQIYDGLDVGNSLIINKPTFGYLAWDKHIKNCEGLTIELIGLCTDICVASNALILKALFPDATIKVDSVACAGVTPSSHEAALTTMKMCQVEVM